ncbi:MAG: hypothetical protein DDT26_01516 [Dehalococcoidia bacterium]|nr:hypothetical protein [Chloroflexota bacterium]MBT9166671.1 hypothetical protein [Chloroflexota bacterium]
MGFLVRRIADEVARAALQLATQDLQGFPCQLRIRSRVLEARNRLQVQASCLGKLII